MGVVWGSLLPPLWSWGLFGVEGESSPAGADSVPVQAGVGTSQEHRRRAALHQLGKSQPEEGMGRREPRGAGWGQREKAGPQICPGKEEKGEAFQALTPTPSALLDEAAGPPITHSVSDSLVQQFMDPGSPGSLWFLDPCLR